MRAGTANSAPAWGTKHVCRAACCDAPSRKARERAKRNADHATDPNAMNMLRLGAQHACAAACAKAPASLKTPLAWAAVKSTIWSPMATPTRKRWGFPGRRNTPNGRFWMGKSQPTSLADATQLHSCGLWVSLSRVMLCQPATKPLPSCIQAACLGAFLVRSHSLSMSHFTSSKAFDMAGVAVLQASSSRWPLGSKK